MKITLTASTPALAAELLALASGTGSAPPEEQPGEHPVGCVLEAPGGDTLGELLRGVIALGARCSAGPVSVETADGRLEIPTNLPAGVLEPFIARVKGLDTPEVHIHVG